MRCMEFLKTLRNLKNHQMPARRQGIKLNKERTFHQEILPFQQSNCVKKTKKKQKKKQQKLKITKEKWKDKRICTYFQWAEEIVEYDAGDDTNRLWSL